ncbi:MAG TPA: hypothetical protein PK778_08325 [Bacillota bacterium]|nr:hypothetical protein [Clostridiales bacterium]HPT85982.1 hypothetical protein [Bacillota bacterium]
MLIRIKNGHIGTPSHVRDTNYPGVCDEIVNLGEFWRTEKLRESGAEIKHIINEKHGHYTRAHAYLHAAEQLESELQRIYSGAILAEKMAAAAKRIIAACYKSKNTGSCGRLVIRPLEAFTAGGVVAFDTFAKFASKRFYIRDERGIGYLFLREIIDGALAHGETIELSYDAYSGKRERAVYLLGADTAFVPYRYDEHGYCEGDKLVNMERFIDPTALTQYKSGIRFTKRYRDLLYAGAAAELQASRALHDRLEVLYGEAMDFARKEEFTKRLLMKIFS